MFDVDIEDALEHTRPTHARRRVVRVGTIGGGIACLLRWTGNDCGTRFGVRGERRAGNVAAQAFELLALIGAAAHRRMQAEAVRVGA